MARMGLTRRFANWSRRTTSGYLDNVSSTLQANGAINPITTGVKRRLIAYAPTMMAGTIGGGAMGAYSGMEDPRSGMLGGAVWGGLTGAVKGGLAGAGAGYAYRRYVAGHQLNKLTKKNATAGAVARNMLGIKPPSR